MRRANWDEAEGHKDESCNCGCGGNAGDGTVADLFASVPDVAVVYRSNGELAWAGELRPTLEYWPGWLGPVLTLGAGWLGPTYWVDWFGTAFT